LIEDPFQRKYQEKAEKKVEELSSQFKAEITTLHATTPYKHGRKVFKAKEHRNNLT
jgi:hypothetical protein